jgi:energy-coupling factor transport system substrate-specific component
MTLSSAIALGGLALLVLGLLAYERGDGGSREIALVATLAATAAAGRVLFAAVPSAQPVTTICIVTGIALGPRAGAAVGAVAALVSNAFLGQGPWTPWQMLTWGLAGASAGMLAPLLRRPWALVAFGAVWGFLFGAIMNLWQLAAFGPALNLPAFLATETRGLPFDLAHAVTNVALLGLAGPALIRLLDRYGRRLRVELVAAPAAVALVAVLALAVTTPPASATPVQAADYLASHLDADGCAAEPGGEPSAALSGWVALGLAAAGRDARPAARCVADRVRELRLTTDVELAVLALVAAGLDPRDVGGRNLVRDIQRAQRGGRIGPLVNSTIFGVLALRAARVPVPTAVRRGLATAQRADGSYGFGAGVPADSNVTAAAVQALLVVGYPRTGRRVQRTLTALQRFRNADGGYGLNRGNRSDAQSTAWAVQALVAAGRRPDVALAYLRRQQRADGSVAYGSGLRITPVWVTSQALAAFSRRPLPIRP